jgi:hypothetical protein
VNKSGVTVEGLTFSEPPPDPPAPIVCTPPPEVICGVESPSAATTDVVKQNNITNNIPTTDQIFSLILNRILDMTTSFRISK